MKKILQVTLIGLCTFTASVSAMDKSSSVYINKGIGFNIEGYNYEQPALPCDVDKKLVELVIAKGNKANLNIEAVETEEKIKNGIVPVVLIDIDELALSKDHNYGVGANHLLPKIKITAGVLKGEDLQTAKHTCVVARTEHNSTMQGDIVKYNNMNVSMCSEVQKCLEGLSKDVVEWLEPQVR